MNLEQLEQWQGKLNCPEKPCPCATLSTANPTLRGLRSNPGYRGGKPVTNRFSYATAFDYVS
jgi:hypothetical protein